MIHLQSKHKYILLKCDPSFSTLHSDPCSSQLHTYIHTHREQSLNFVALSDRHVHDNSSTCAKSEHEPEDHLQNDETGQRQDNYLEAESGLDCPEVCQSDRIYCSETVRKDKNNKSFKRRSHAAQTETMRQSKTNQTKEPADKDSRKDLCAQGGRQDTEVTQPNHPRTSTQHHSHHQIYFYRSKAGSYLTGTPLRSDYNYSFTTKEQHSYYTGVKNTISHIDWKTKIMTFCFWLHACTWWVGVYHLRSFPVCVRTCEIPKCVSVPQILK